MVPHARPLDSGRLRPDVVRHARRARREDGEVAAALFLQLELRLYALHQLLVADAELVGGGLPHRVGEPGELLVAEGEQGLRLGRVVTVDVDDHGALCVLFYHGPDPYSAASGNEKPRTPDRRRGRP